MLVFITLMINYVTNLRSCGAMVKDLIQNENEWFKSSHLQPKNVRLLRFFA